MTPPKFPLLMPVWTNKVGILRPDQSNGKPAPWVVSGIRLQKHYDHDAEVSSYSGYEYLIGGVDGGEDDYGWVGEAELVKAEYPAPDWFNRALTPAQDDPDDVRNMPAVNVG